MPRVVRKKRPKRGPRSMHPGGCVSAIIYVVFVIGASMLIAAGIIMAANEVFAFVKPDLEVTLTLKKGEDPGVVGEMLREERVISYPFLFKLVSDISEKNEFVEGEHKLNAKMDYRTIMNILTGKAASGKRETVTVTVPEGYNYRQIVDLLVENEVCTRDELADAARTYDFNYSFIRSLPKTESRLEGYLFPDTYVFYKNDKAPNVWAKFLSNFNNKFDEDFQYLLTESGMSMQDAIIIASMVEREAKLDEERPVIASVILNRLASDNYKLLQIDATILYALPEHKEALTAEDLELDSPYNTYLYPGLPPTPIANPGLASIEAVLYPETTSYYFYVARPDGSHLFAKNNSEHERNRAQANREFEAAAAGD